ncbi:hypothetical protein GOQ30_15080 [Flavobacterium sp. TP390]|uniref:Uncharacterized protein n=1 Tax=Flavobacterium profundi TaxID=1774945 RepID=A0A6I4IUL4_9FLAO|nr:hypothetical protein [Flavobacterium profundi]MVO10495.1 hypothetical protein [Flavobacterium profundi]
MNRKDFILFFISKRIKPFLILSFLFVVIYFFIQVIFNKDSNERNIFILCSLGLGIIVAFMTIHFFARKVKNQLSIKAKMIVNSIVLFFKIISILFLLGLTIQLIIESKLLELFMMLIPGLTSFLIYTKKTKLN